MLFGACWTPRSSNTETLPAAPIRRAAARSSSSSTPLRARVVGDRDLAQRREHGLGVVDVLGEELVVEEVLLDERRGERRQAPGVGPRAAPAGGSRRASRCR